MKTFLEYFLNKFKTFGHFQTFLYNLTAFSKSFQQICKKNSKHFDNVFKTPGNIFMTSDDIFIRFTTIWQHFQKKIYNIVKTFLKTLLKLMAYNFRRFKRMTMFSKQTVFNIFKSNNLTFSKQTFLQHFQDIWHFQNNFKLY